jgi:predicted dehydrogenase
VTPRLGFLGVGWIGRQRMEAVVRSGAGKALVVADAVSEVAEEAARAVGAEAAPVDALLDGTYPLDGLVIATPSALHAEQAVAALAQGVAVCCQKPLGRNVSETRTVVDAARRADLLLGVDLSYRHLAAVEAMRAEDVGEVYAAELAFHNAYGPDKPWFLDPALSGGGCVVDLGIHLVDLLLWLTGLGVADVSARLYRHGAPVRDGEVEDHAVATLGLTNGGVATLACSWFLPAGQDAEIRASFYGTKGAIELRNVGGSFYDFTAWRNDGTTRRVLAEPPDEWGGRAVVDWARRIGGGFDPAADELVAVADVLDRVYGR